jgi:hypothetical protein
MGLGYGPIGRAWVGGVMREGNGPFQGSPERVVLFGAGFSFPYVANERLP